MAISAKFAISWIQYQRIREFDELFKAFAEAAALLRERAAQRFLAERERSGFINGVALPVDGGWVSDGSWQSLRMKKR